MIDFTTIDERWGLWVPSEGESAHFCATRATVEWLCSQRDGETDPSMANAYDALAQRAFEVHAEAAEPPLTQSETELAWDLARDIADGWKSRDHADDWMQAWGRKGAREVIAEHIHFSLHFPGSATRPTDAVAATTIQGDISPDPIICSIMLDLIMDSNVDYYGQRIRALERLVAERRRARKKAAGS